MLPSFHLKLRCPYSKCHRLSKCMYLLSPWTPKILISGRRFKWKLRHNFLVLNILIKSRHSDLLIIVFIFTQLWKYGRRIRCQFWVWGRGLFLLLNIVLPNDHGARWLGSFVLLEDHWHVVSDELLWALFTLYVDAAIWGVCSEGWVIVTWGAKFAVILGVVSLGHELVDVSSLETHSKRLKLAVCTSSVRLCLSSHLVRPLVIIPRPRLNLHLWLKILFWRTLNIAFL